MDIDAVADLYTQFFQSVADLQPDYYKAVMGGKDYPKSVIASKDADILVAEEVGRVVGFAHVEERKTLPYDCIIPMCYGVLVDIAVEESYRSRGVGKALVNAAKAWTKQRGLHYMELMVQKENETALSLYHKEGFAVASHTMRCKL